MIRRRYHFEFPITQIPNSSQHIRVTFAPSIKRGYKTDSTLVYWTVANRHRAQPVISAAAASLAPAAPAAAAAADILPAIPCFLWYDIAKVIIFILAAFPDKFCAVEARFQLQTSNNEYAAIPAMWHE